MRHRRWVWGLLSVLLLLMLACFGGDDDEPTEESLPATATPKAVSSSVDTGATLEVTNASGTDILYLYMSPSGQEDWGDDWLQGEVIQDGGTYLLSEIEEGTYDVKALDADEAIIQTLAAVEIEGDVAWTVEALATLEILNNSESTIGGIYLSVPGSGLEEEEILSGATIDPGSSYVVAEVPRGMYDVEATDVDGDFVEKVYDVVLYGQNTWTVLGKTSLPDAAVLRFEDDFSDNRNGWGNDDGEDVNYMAPANGEYCILIKSEKMTAWEWYDPFRTEEFVAEVSCYPEEGSTGGCGLGFGPDGDNVYWFEVTPYDQTFGLFVVENGSWQDPLIDWSTSKNIIPDEPNTLSLERVNGVVSLYINGVLAGQLENDLFPTGRVGLGGSSYSEGNIEVCLDDLRVWSLQ